MHLNEASGGASLESILVFAGGFLAAVAAVVAALLTTRGAAKRLETSLEVERQRFDRQLQAETHRIEQQLEHERQKDRRLEAGITVERIARTVSRNSARVTGMALELLTGNALAEEQLKAFDRGLDELREEFSILALRFDKHSPIHAGLASYLKAVGHVIPPPSELPIEGEERKARLEDDVNGMDAAEMEFLQAARESLDVL